MTTTGKYLVAHMYLGSRALGGTWRLGGTKKATLVGGGPWSKRHMSTCFRQRSL